MARKISDLTAHLFDQLDRLSVPDMTPEQIEQEVARTEAIVSIADRITQGTDLQLKAAKLYAEHGQVILPMLPQIGKAAE